MRKRIVWLLVLLIVVACVPGGQIPAFQVVTPEFPVTVAAPVTAAPAALQATVQATATVNPCKDADFVKDFLRQHGMLTIGDFTLSYSQVTADLVAALARLAKLRDDGIDCKVDKVKIDDTGVSFRINP